MTDKEGKRFMLERIPEATIIRLDTDDTKGATAMTYTYYDEKYKRTVERWCWWYTESHYKDLNRAIVTDSQVNLLIGKYAMPADVKGGHPKPYINERLESIWITSK